ncbi:MAG: CatB-related O-acetyltransferase [Flavobacteriales bacterium]|nr:CatB-related O-acetyltransferase [Flavobacteriales bacterium]
MKQILKSCPALNWLASTLHRLNVLNSNRGKQLMMGFRNKVTRVQFGNYNLLTNDIIIRDSVIGDYSYVNNRSIIQDAVIGKFCCIGEDVRIGLGIHPVDTVSMHPAFYSNKKSHYFADSNMFEEYETVQVGNDVWIGAGAKILDGVTIHDGAVVAAGAIVTKDVQPYCIVGGIPAKVIRKRFDDEQIAFLLQDRWWDRSFDYLKKNHLQFTDTVRYMKFAKANSETNSQLM